MTFDGVQYREADLVLPTKYAPRSPLTGPALGDVLRLGYAHARCHSQLVLEQTYGYSLRAVRPSFGSWASTWIRLAEGYRRIHVASTHLVAEIHYSALDVADLGRSFHRVVVVDGGNTDTGATTELTLDVQPAPTEAQRFSPFEDSRVYVARCEVGFGTIIPGNTCVVYVEGYALRGSAGAAYVPHHVCVWMETRG